MQKKPIVDQDTCIGCETCTLICPEVFRMNESGEDHHDHKAEVYDPSGAPEEKIEEAMDNCPVACIHWED